MNDEQYKPCVSKEEAEKYRLYFSQKLIEHSIGPEVFEEFEKTDRRIDIEAERFLNMLRPPGTGRN